MSRRAQRGMTLLELIVAMSIMCIFLSILLTLTLEMWKWEKKLPVDFLKHPQIISVISRMRRDVLSAHTTRPYFAEYEGYTESPKNLMLQTVTEAGGTQDVIWDFSTPGVVVRRAYNVGNVTEWRARGVPIDFTIELIEVPGRPHMVRLTATDKEGRIAINQVFFPRTTG